MSENISSIDPVLQGGDSSPSQGSDPASRQGRIDGSPEPIVVPKKFPLFSVILLLILSIVSVICVYLFLQVRELSMSKPVPSPSSVPVTDTDPTSNWLTYSNQDLGFEIMYPPNMKIEKELNDEHNRFTQIKGNDLDVQVMLRKSDNISFDNYYYMDNIIANTSILGGEKANVYIQDVSKSGCVDNGEGPGCPLSFVSYAAIKSGNIYHLGFFGDAALSDIEKQILSTFKFTDSSTSYTCPASGYADCMPSPDGPKPSCSKEAMDWYKANCPDFKGAAL